MLLNQIARCCLYYGLHLTFAITLIMYTGQCSADQPVIKKLVELSLEDLSDIHVSVASLFSESDLVVASTVTLITEEDWQRAGARRTNDAIKHLPSVMVLPHLFGGDAISIRGYTQILSIRGVATLIDGVPINSFSTGTAQYNVVNFGLGALNTIEMIRGPGSAIYGSDAFHGVLAFNTFESTSDADQLSSAVGNEGYYQASFQDSREIGDSLRSNIALTASGDDQGHRYYYTNPSNGIEQPAQRDRQYDSRTGVIKLISDPEAPWSYRWGLYWDSYDTEQFPGFGRALSGSRSALGAKDWSGNDTKLSMTNFSITRTLPNQMTVQWKNFYWQSVNDWFSNRPASLNRVGEVVQHQVNTRYGSDLIVKQETNSWNTQWVASIGYNNMQVEESDLMTFSPEGAFVSRVIEPFNGLDRSIYDVFLQARTSFFDNKMQLLYGGRIDDYADFGLQRTPRVGIIFLPKSDLAIKLLYGEAFRAPVAGEVSGTVTVRRNPDLKPEVNSTYEFTVLKYLKNGRAEVTLFKNFWKDGIVAVPINEDGYQLEYRNTNRSRSEGIELAYNMTSDSWRGDVSASYVHSLNELTQIGYDAFPRVILNAGIGYQFVNGVEFYVNNRFYCNAKAGPTTSTIPNPASLSSYWRTDIHMEKKLSSSFELSLDIQNIFDRNNTLPSMMSAERGIPDDSLGVALGFHYNF